MCISTLLLSLLTVASLLFSTDHYDPDYEFLQQDLSNADQLPQQGPTALSPLPESLGEAGSPFYGRTFQLPVAAALAAEVPPALPEKKRRGTVNPTFDTSGCRVLFERHPSQYDNISEDDLHNPTLLPPMTITPFATVLPFQPGNSPAPVEFLTDFLIPDSTSDSEKPPPLPEKKNKHSKCEIDSVSHGSCAHCSSGRGSMLVESLKIMQILSRAKRPDNTSLCKPEKTVYSLRRKEQRGFAFFGSCT